MKKLIIIIVIIFFSAMSAGLFVSRVFSTSDNTSNNSTEIDELNKKIEEKKNRVKQLEESIATYKKKIAGTRLEATSLTNQISILDNHIKQVELDIEVTKNKLDTLSLEIDTLNLEIENKEKSIERQKNIISELVRTINENSNRSYLEIFAAYNSFSDFYNRLQYLKNIERDIGKSVTAVRISKEELQGKKQQKEEIKLSFEKLNQEYTQKKKDLDEEIFGKSNLLAQTHSSELKFSTLVNSLKSQYQEVEGEIEGIEQEVRKRLESQNKLEEDPGEGNLSWPTQSRYITSGFHDPDYPYRYVFEHNAIDIRASQGTPIKAAASGYVARAKKCTLSSCYSYVMLVHAGGISTVYGHLSRINVSEDNFVTRGDVIGLSGGTPGTAGAGPFVTGPHLHFEVRKEGIPVNPLGYLVKDY